MSENAGHREVVIGRPGGDQLAIRVVGRMHGGADDFWDGNWLVSPVEITAGDFQAQIGAALRSEELRAFREGLERIDAGLSGAAALESMEEWLSLSVTVRSRGHLEVRGRAVDRPGGGNELRFTVGDLDLSDLPGILAALAAVEEAFPVMGTP